MSHILENSIYARDKKSKLVLSKHARKMLVELASGEKAPTIDEITQRMGCDNLKAEKLLKAIKIKRRQLADITGTKLPGMQQTGKEGFIYLIRNPVYPGWIKCGMATCCRSRLKSYNGYDPTGGFSFIAQKSVNDRRRSEKQLLQEVALKADIQNGEWFKISENICLEIFNKI